MALTYDDGPNTAWTPQLMEVLDKHDVKATFFTIGKYAEQQPELLRQVAEAGHAIGNHTYNHVTMALHTDDTIRARAANDHRGDRGRGRRDGHGSGQEADAAALRPPPARHDAGAARRRATSASPGR